MFDRKCKIIFIRHGSTIYTEQNRLYDMDDYPPVNEMGKMEMEKISKWLESSCPDFDIIYTSSALRSIQSARIIAKHFKTDFEIIDDLYERRSGIWGGLTFDQIREKYPEMYETYQINPCSFCPEGGESTIEVNKRVDRVIKELIEKNHKKRIVVISHAGVIQSAVSLALTVSPRNQTRIYVPTGSATQINYYEKWESMVYSGYLPL